MSEKNMLIKPIAAAVGVALATSFAFSTTAIAADNPFAAADLDSGYMIAGDDKDKEGKCSEGKCSEGKCSGDKAKEGDCSGDKAKEGDCSHDKSKDSDVLEDADPNFDMPDPDATDQG